MRVTVYFHVNLLMKSFAAVWTDKRFKIGVRAHVRMQIGCPVESLVTLRAYVGFHSRVSEAMPSQISWLSKSSATNFTLEWFVPGMYSL